MTVAVAWQLGWLPRRKTDSEYLADSWLNVNKYRWQIETQDVFLCSHQESIKELFWPSKFWAALLAFLGRRHQLSILPCPLLNSVRNVHHFKVKKNKHCIDVGGDLSDLTEKGQTEGLQLFLVHHINRYWGMLSKFSGEHIFTIRSSCCQGLAI